MAIDFITGCSILRMGVDVLTTTDISEVPYRDDPSHVPVYSLETGVLAREEGGETEWTFLRDVAPENLPAEVEAMHWDYKGGVRLLEDGRPVFECWSY